MKIIYKIEDPTLYLNESTIIYEKINAPRISVRKENGKLIFANNKSDLGLVERTYCSIFENSIEYLETFEKYIHEGFELGFKSFYSNKPALIEYQNLPKNNLILTDIKINDKFQNNVLLLNEWADKLDVNRAPILWNGKLDETLVNNIYDGKFDVILESLGIKKTTLNEDLNSIIDSLIFQFSEETLILKDPKFLSEEVKIQESRKPSDSYGILVQDIIEFVEVNKVDYSLKETGIEERYVEIISKIFNQYTRIRKKDFSGIELKLPHTNNKAFELNQKWIKNKKTLDLLKSKENQEVFKVILDLFHHPKRKSSGLISSQIVKSIKYWHKKIKDKVENVNESEFPSFLDFIE